MKDKNLFETKMSRKEFIKKAAASTAILAAALAFAPEAVASEAATVEITDNITAGVSIGPTAPANSRTLWVDTSDSGILKYNNGTTWTPAAAGKATTTMTARAVTVDLESETAASFDGSADITPGVSGELPVTHGGTGAATAAGARTNLGITGGNVPMTSYTKAATAGTAIAATDSVNEAIGKLEKTLESASSTATSHTPGNITNDGKVGTTASLALTTGTGGAVQATNLTTNSPSTTNAATTEFVDTISQASNGKITATKRKLPTASTSQAGIVQLGTGAANAAAGNHTHNYAASNHTHNYAGSTSAGGVANSAAKLSNTSAIGDANNPVYFSNGGVPVASNVRVYNGIMQYKSGNTWVNCKSVWG